MSDTKQPPPNPDQETQNKPLVSVFEARVLGKNAWTGLVVGMVLQSPGLISMIIDPLGGFFIYCGLAMLVFFAAIVVFLCRLWHIGLGLILSLGVFFVLMVGSCMLGIISSPKPMH